MTIAKLILDALFSIATWIMTLREEDAKKVIASMLEWHTKAKAAYAAADADSAAEIERGRAELDHLKNPGATGGSGPTHL